MTIRSTIAVFVVLTCLAAGCGTDDDTTASEPPATTTPTAATAPLAPTTTVPDSLLSEPTLDIDALVQQWATSADVVGAVATVSTPNQPDRLVLTGSADRETLEPTSAAKSYRIGSITKLFTAVVVLDLIEDGALALDDPVADYLPGADSAMTVRQLLNHTSGLSDLDIAEDIVSASLDPSTVTAPQDAVAQAIDAGVMWPPGSQEHYSSLNYLLLGQIIEQVTGEAYESALERLVLEPLELDNTGFEDETTALATPYERLDPSAAPIALGGFPTDVAVRASSSAGGLVSTSADLVEFINALFDGRILALSTLGQMLDGPTTTDARYGLGPAGYELGSRTVYGHNGRSIGFAASVRHDPDTGVTVVVLANDGSAPTSDIANQLIEAAVELCAQDARLC